MVRRVRGKTFKHASRHDIWAVDPADFSYQNGIVVASSDESDLDLCAYKSLDVYDQVLWSHRVPVRGWKNRETNVEAHGDRNRFPAKRAAKDGDRNLWNPRTNSYDFLGRAGHVYLWDGSNFNDAGMITEYYPEA